MTTTAAILIRPATPDDAKHIEALYRQLVSDDKVCVLPEQIADLARDPRTHLFVATQDAAVCATVLLNICADAMFKAQPFAVVENIVVDTERRGQGIGALLLHHVEAECLALGCSKIMLQSAVERDEAHRFFEQCGFTGSRKKGFVRYRRDFRDKASAVPASNASKT
ncbi:UNVERIFIED_ORG: N-acetylglutamate synthase-like GNAT family acetyltransferase [Variovorax paradoxus]|nr:N-acetylglutamate synthase-like GNAT family acetyltransferase [Variovorax paradoxus]